MNELPADQSFELPDWMHPHHGAIDWGLVLVLALSLLAALPFLANPGLPRQTDAELHVFRTAELTNAIREGVIYPRWAPNFWYGYGYPFFNYYASLTYYLGAGYGLLTGTGPVGGARFVFILGFMLAGLGTYAFVRRRWNAPAGVLAAVVYVYSPYIILVDPHMRGDLAETFALAVFPGVMWAFDRLLEEGRGWHAVRAAALLAALIFTHNLMALLLTALLVGWLLWVTAFTEAAHKRLTWLGAALGVGLAGVLLGAGAAGGQRGPARPACRTRPLRLPEPLPQRGRAAAAVAGARPERGQPGVCAQPGRGRVGAGAARRGGAGRAGARPEDAAQTARRHARRLAADV
ncbi:MAG: 6-pyruvoyl-tetrahydropterin synthase-related protein [Anaerolineae bacterium]|nr:6-pyruvoyl-tetrahydropterin synthase-related protein [Anaerolineae bacterium]